MEEKMTGFCITKATNACSANASGGGGGGGGGGGTGTKCGRWNPTTEQVKVLTDLFRSGLRTPSTDQIQKISTQLSFYGKIESKNVFYWFQNHKARERQKRRRVSLDFDKDLHANNIIRREDSISSSARYFAEINQNKISGNNQKEKVIETLQLFPLNSLYEGRTENFRLHANDQCKEPTFAYTFGGSDMDRPPLDLRLSFV